MDEAHATDLEAQVKKAAGGNTEAFRALFELLSDQLFTYALSHAKTRDDALDVVQETFVELWNALPKFTYESRQAFYGFVYVILKRRLYRHYEKSRRTETAQLEESHLAEICEVGTEDYRYLHGSLKKLPERYQELIRLRYWSSLSFSEIADCMSIKENTAKVWHYRALKELQKSSDYLV